MATIDDLIVGPTLSRAGLRDLSLTGKAPRAGTFKHLTLGALRLLATALEQPDDPIPEGSGTTGDKRRHYLDHISVRLLPRLHDRDGDLLTSSHASSQPVFGSGRSLGGVPGGGGGRADDARLAYDTLGPAGRSSSSSHSRSLDAYSTSSSRDTGVRPRRTQQLLNTVGVTPAFGSGRSLSGDGDGGEGADDARPAYDTLGSANCSRSSSHSRFLGGVTGDASSASSSRAIGVPPRRIQQLPHTAGVTPNADLLSNFVPPVPGETETAYADVIIQVVKELRLVDSGVVTAGGARARLIKYLQKHPLTNINRDDMWMAVIERAEADKVPALLPTSPEPWVGDKRVKNISPAFKEVVSKAYNYAAGSPAVMETLSQTTLSTLHTAAQNLEPSLAALVPNAAIHDQLAGKVALVVKLLFRLSVSSVETGLFPISFRSNSSGLSHGKDSVYKAAATARVRGSLDLATWYPAFCTMASRDSRRQALVDQVPKAQWKSSQFPRSACLWPELQAFLNYKLPVISHTNLGNVVCIATDLTQRGMATEQVASLMDEVFSILAQEIDEVRLGQRTSLPNVSTN